MAAEPSAVYEDITEMGVAWSWTGYYGVDTLIQCMKLGDYYFPSYNAEPPNEQGLMTAALLGFDETVVVGYANGRAGPGGGYYNWNTETGIPYWEVLEMTQETIRAANIVDLVLGKSADTDDDGMDDAWEMDHFGDLTTADATSNHDGDIAGDLLEFLAGTDPQADDFTAATNTDGDGLPDYWEFYFFNNLALANNTSNNDSDAATDLLEYLAGGNAADPGSSVYNPEVSDFTAETDSDGDGMPDVWEYQHFGNLSQTAASDNDSDGLTNGEEYTIGTDPTDNDTDNDGLLDGVETGTGTFVSAGDTGSDPLDADSDNDGWNDGAEVSQGFDPNDPGSHPTSGGGDGSTKGACGAGAAGMLLCLLVMAGVTWRPRRSSPVTSIGRGAVFSV